MAAGHVTLCGISATASPQAVEGFGQEDVTVHLVGANVRLVGVQPPAADQVSESLEGSRGIRAQEW